MDSRIIGPIPCSQTGERIQSTLRSGWRGWLERNAARILDAALVRLYPWRQERIFSTGLVGTSLHRCTRVIEADIVNLHWIARGPLSLRGIRRLDKPTVWTLRDMWPFTGGCHYAMACRRYQQACGHCPQLGSGRERDLSRRLWRWKRRCLRPDIRFVGISEWLSDSARRSGLLKDADIRTISNCVDTEVFFPVERAAARDALGLPGDKAIVLCAAGSLGNFYKAFDLFWQAAGTLDPERTLIVLAGTSQGVDFPECPAQVRNLGYLEDDERMRLAYSAADVFVAPSRQEAFGKTLVEAMACGTPVVCFDATGPGEIVAHEVCGYKARAFDVDDLAAGIRWVLHVADRQALAGESLRRVQRLYAKEVVAEHYATLYRELLAETA